jgi:hypothetical protein
MTSILGEKLEIAKVITILGWRGHQKRTLRSADMNFCLFSNVIKGHTHTTSLFNLEKILRTYILFHYLYLGKYRVHSLSSYP